MSGRNNSARRFGGTQYDIGPADTQRRIRDERDIYANRLRAAERRIEELEAQLGARPVNKAELAEWLQNAVPDPAVPHSVAYIVRSEAGS